MCQICGLLCILVPLLYMLYLMRRRSSSTTAEDPDKQTPADATHLATENPIYAHATDKPMVEAPDQVSQVRATPAC
jgi:hypothetical protein